MRNGQKIASRVSEDLVRDLALIEEQEQTDRSTTVVKLLRRAIADWKRDFYARQYGDGQITLARAAQQADVSLWEMMDYVRQRKIGAQYDMNDLRRDLATIEAGESHV